MTKVTIRSGETLDTFYERTLQYFKDTYHNYPTQLSGKPIGHKAHERINHYDAMARGSVSSGGRDWIDGKDVA